MSKALFWIEQTLKQVTLYVLLKPLGPVVAIFNRKQNVTYM